VKFAGSSLFQKAVIVSLEPALLVMWNSRFEPPSYSETVAPTVRRPNFHCRSATPCPESGLNGSTNGTVPVWTESASRSYSAAPSASVNVSGFWLPST
jgi:hypothetical protein